MEDGADEDEFEFDASYFLPDGIADEMYAAAPATPRGSPFPPRRTRHEACSVMLSWSTVARR